MRNYIPMRLNELLQERGMNMRQLSQRSGVSYTEIRNICIGERTNPRLDIFAKLCKGLDIKMTEFFDERSDNTIPSSSNYVN